MSKLAVVAFGGNALLRAGQAGTFEEQLENVTRTCSQLRPLLREGYNIIIGHGNGPQVGSALLRHEAGHRQFGLPAMPMDFCGAETQGSIAYLIETAMERVLREEGIDRRVVSIVTRVEVDAADEMFSNPTKPVGPYYTVAEAEALAASGAGVYREDPRGRGWRKVVASPKPVRISNIDLVGRLAREGNIVVTVGGGGIPVVASEAGHRGVEAVIDKDLASALAAVQVGADEFYILTDVPKVYINFRTSSQQALDTMTVAEAERYLAEGMFTEGSMAPKVRAGIYFVTANTATEDRAPSAGQGDDASEFRQCVITEASELQNPACGTRIIQ
ncbi:MAG: carbamate kinase [Bacteroidales bacterium]|nr:carbamate kinase [Bacteroidales bacterium]